MRFYLSVKPHFDKIYKLTFFDADSNVGVMLYPRLSGTIFFVRHSIGQSCPLTAFSIHELLCVLVLISFRR